MAEKTEKLDADDSASITDEHSPEEREYFDTRGEKGPKAKDRFEKREEKDAVKAEKKAEKDEISDDETAESEEVEGEVEIEAEAESDDKGKGKSKAPPQYVPVAELRREREKRQKIESQIARMEARFAEIQRSVQPPAEQPQQPPEMPDPDVDPLGAIKYVANQVKAVGEQTKQTAEARTRAAEHQRQFQALMSRYTSAVSEYEQEAPDFREAYNHLVADRHKELQLVGYADPGLRERIIQSEELGIVTQALQDGANPAERIYSLAKKRGWQKPAAKEEAEADDEPTPAERQAATRSLSNLGGRTVRKVKLADLADMSDAEWGRKVTDRDSFRRLIAGG